jgi:hypothetical protein
MVDFVYLLVSGNPDIFSVGVSEPTSPLGLTIFDSQELKEGFSKDLENE